MYIYIYYKVLMEVFEEIISIFLFRIVLQEKRPRRKIKKRPH